MRIVIISILAGALIDSSCGQQAVTSVKTKARATPVHSGRSHRESELVRVPDQLHVYRVGRLPDGDSMRDAGKYYHVSKAPTGTGLTLLDGLSR